MPAQESCNIYNYLNYRDFLKDFLGSKKAKNPALSLEYYRNRFGFSSRGYLHNILTGKRQLKFIHAKSVCSTLKFSRLESRYFRLLLQLERAQNLKEKTEYLKETVRLQKLAAARGGAPEASVHRKSGYFLNWHYPVVRAMVALPDFEPNGAWIAQRLSHTISAAEAEKAFTDLRDWGYLSVGDHDKWKLQEPQAWIDDSQANPALKIYQQKMITKAAQALDLPREHRAFGSLTLTCSRAKVQRAQKLLNDFLKRFEDEIEELESTDSLEVHFLEIGFFPLTQEMDKL